ncbi:metal-dependent hydrolase [Pseudomonas sp.]|uniref:metal-dependent hydrolase n=1 Tax=Pseudomonas sp. TaxID=306 RepID=UPI003CC659EE
MSSHDLVPTPRNLHFDLPAERICDWYQHCRYMSHWSNSLSIMAPVFERFVIQAIRAHESTLADVPLLSQQVKALIDQEAVHAREHRRYNNLIDLAGLPATRIARRWQTLLHHTLESRWVSNRMRLAATMMFEHHAAMIAGQELRTRKNTPDMEPRFLALWNWHALEEIEHKSVSFDLWRHTLAPGPVRYGLRTSTVLLLSVPFWYMIFESFLRLIWADRHSTEHVHGAWRLAKYLWGPHGFFFGNSRGWLAYFKPGFDPWTDDDVALLKPLEQDRL